MFCLVIPFRRFRQLVVIVTAFTIAHSITLIVSAFGLAPDALWFPPLIETLIAVSIVYMALENIVIAATGPTPQRGQTAPLRRWMITFAFGLVHGFGFSFALRRDAAVRGRAPAVVAAVVQRRRRARPDARARVLLPALHLLFRYVVAERLGTIILSALVAHTAWHWMQDRVAALREFTWPAFDAATAVWIVRGLMLALVLFAGWRVIVGRFRRSGLAAIESDTPLKTKE